MSLALLFQKIRELIRGAIDWVLTLFQWLAERVFSMVAGWFEVGPPLLNSSAPSAQEVPPQQATMAPQTAAESPADDLSEETALARMLASEERPQSVKTVVGWIAIQKAQARKKTLYQMLTRGLGYGPQDRSQTGQGVVFASTAKPATLADRTLARGLLDGSIKPSAAIRRHRPGGWAQRGQALSDDKIVLQQGERKEGLYARIAGTRWVLYSPDASVRATRPGETASQLLDRLPEVPAVDSQPQATV